MAVDRTIRRPQQPSTANRPWDLPRSLKSRYVPLWRQLRWKLTLSHAAVTVSALLVVELILIIGMLAFFVINSGLSPEKLFDGLAKSYIPIIKPYLEKSPPNINGLARYLRQFESNIVLTEPSAILGNIQIDMSSKETLTVIFLTADGQLIDTVPHDVIANAETGDQFDDQLFPELREPIQAALDGETDHRELYAISFPQYKLYGAVPVWNEKETRLLGVIAFSTKSLPWELWPLGDLMVQVGYSLIFFTVLAGIVGTLFGSLTARDLVQRLKRLSEATHAWSQGDLTVVVNDATGDELGRLAHDLNSMARQLENLLHQRAKMSVLQERNRLARDLHDSVKQQAFAAAAQLATARAYLETKPAEADAHLQEAETLVNSVRQELTHLIQELRPADEPARSQ